MDQLSRDLELFINNETRGWLTRKVCLIARRPTQLEIGPDMRGEKELKVSLGKCEILLTGCAYLRVGPL